MNTPVAPIVTERHACTVGLKSLFKIINERSPEGKEARSFFERTKTSTQCKSVIPYKSECWLCGNPFQSANVWFSPQCEHILPVAQGVIFLELYNARFKNINDAVKLEYEWAHAICNNLKNDSVLIKGTEGAFEPDVDAIHNLLTKIHEKGIPMDEEQILHVQGRLFQITEYINKLPDYNINTTSLCSRKLVFKGGKKLKRKHNGKSVRRIAAKGHGSNSRTHRKIRTSTRKRP